MTSAVQELLRSFDALTDEEKQEATAELLRRALIDAPGDLPDEALTALADELFVELDAREAADEAS